MSFRRLQSLLAVFSVCGYLAATVGGVWLHDHEHSRLSDCSGCAEQTATQSHPACSCGHDHCLLAESEDTADESETPCCPCDHPLHDDGCLLCQSMADMPIFSTFAVVVEEEGFVTAFVMTSAQYVDSPAPQHFRSRAPPTV